MQEMPSHPGNPGAATPAIILADDRRSGLAVRQAFQPDRRVRLESLTYADAQVVRRHWQMLAMAGGILAVSLVLRVRSDDHAAFAFLPDWPIPSTCPSQIIFGVDCPGCGLTRSFIYLANGDWQRAYAKNRVGWLLALAVVLQIPYRLAGLLGRNRQPLGKRLPQLFGMALIAALIGNWLMMMFHV